jgi:hypothetical protein
MPSLMQTCPRTLTLLLYALVQVQNDDVRRKQTTLSPTTSDLYSVKYRLPQEVKQADCMMKNIV